MNNNEQTLEMQIKAKSEEAVRSLDKLILTLTGVEKSVNNIDKAVNKSNVGKVTKDVDLLDKNVQKATSSTDKLKKALSFGATYIGAKRLTNQFLDWMKESVDFTEQLNLFNVVFKNVEKDGVKAFSTLGKEATRFQNRLNESFGTNKTQTLYTQGIYQSMGENVGIPDMYSAIMSETMTKMTYDLASLYNKSEQSTAEAIRAGVYAGQTKPLRSFGIDVTQMSMQPIVNQLGITDKNGDIKSVKNMSQAEKEILRYIATLNQAKVAMGDFANTIESPANQMKIFKQQLVETKVAVTSLFIGTFANILPYANAFLMVVKEISKSIADMFGIKLSDYNTGIGSQGDAFEGLEDSVTGATEAVKEFKRQSLGFDQIHNISENKDSGIGGSSSVSGGIDQRLLDAIKGYDNGMESVRMKASQIRDSIMEWLGFTKEIDPLTGEVSFKLKDGYSNLKLIGGVIGTLFGLKIISKIKGIATAILGTGENLTLIGKLLKSLKISGWAGTIAKIGTKLKSVLPFIGKVSLGIGGLVSAVTGTIDVYKGFDKVTNGVNVSVGETSVNILKTVGGFSALGFAVGGPIGGLIGALTGTVVMGVSAWMGYNDAMTKLYESQIFGNLSLSVSQWESILKSSTTQMDDLSIKQNSLKENLESLGLSFKENADKVDLFNYRYAVLGQKISKENTETIISSVNEMCKTTSKAIDENINYQIDLWGNFFTERGSLNDDENKKFLQNIINYGDKQKKELSTTQNNITSTYENAIKTRGYLTDEEYDYIREQLNKIKELTNAQMSQANTDVMYWKNKISDDSLAIDKESYSRLKEAMEKFHGEQEEIIGNNYNKRYNALQLLHKNSELSEEDYQKRLKEINEQRNTETDNLNKELLDIQDRVLSGLKVEYAKLFNETTDEARHNRETIENVWKGIKGDTKDLEDFAKRSANAFSSKYLGDIKKELSTPFKATIDFNANMTPFQNTFNQMKNELNTKWNTNLPSINIPKNYNFPAYANGGMPEDGFFFANHSELVGQFSNGKTAVANNMQIEAGIEEASYRGFARAFAQFGNVGGQTSEIDVHVHTDEGTVIDKVEQRIKQTGQFPWAIPTY